MEQGSNEENEPQQRGPWRVRGKVRGSVITTQATLHLEAVVEGGRKCVADAVGMFTATGEEGVELKEARLGTDNMEELCARGTRFFFSLHPTGFRVAFYDAQDVIKLGALHAEPLLVAGNPGSGVARWYPTNPPPPQNDEDEASEQPIHMPSDDEDEASELPIHMPSETLERAPEGVEELAQQNVDAAGEVEVQSKTLDHLMVYAKVEEYGSSCASKE